MRVGIVALDNPFPPDYGGAADMYQRIKAFAEAGMAVDLVYFHKKARSAAHPELTRLCRSVRAVARQTRAVMSSLPYIVASRRGNGDFDGFPVIVEGVHGSLFSGRRAKTILRVHNIESEYYSELAERERLGWKKAFYVAESRKLARYEPQAWAKADVLACISYDETQRLRAAGYNAHWLPPFSPVRIFPPAHERIVLFYGNLFVNENYQTALRALNTRLPDGWTWTVAGKGAKRLPPMPCVRLVDSPPDMDALVAAASALVFPQTQRSGLKIKVWHALATNKAVVVTPQALAGTGIGFDPERGIFAFDDSLHHVLSNLKPHYDRPEIHNLVSGRQPDTGLAAWKKILFHGQAGSVN